MPYEMPTWNGWYRESSSKSASAPNYSVTASPLNFPLQPVTYPAYYEMPYTWPQQFPYPQTMRSVDGDGNEIEYELRLFPPIPPLFPPVPPPFLYPPRPIYYPPRPYPYPPFIW